jgi:hypothetical protein
MCALGSGVTTPASPTFPTAGNSVTWTCGGSNGGASSSTCTATRAAAPTTATLTLVKTVVGGTRTITDFPLTATGPTTITGTSGAGAITLATVTAGSYTLSETTHSDYTVGVWSCTKNPGAVVTTGSSLTLAAGDSAICTIQNVYVAPQGSGGSNSYTTTPAPLIDVKKVPSPLALPNGPGPVTYTYTLKNIGTVPVSNVTMIGDTCSPIVLQSGDANGDSILQTTETWVYTCTKTITATHTNTVTATGTYNGITAIDVTSATVVVGVPIVPPLIHVTKIPSPLALSAGGGTVAYTEKVTNPGTVSLSNVQIVDDKCNPVKYISGDINGNSLLEPTETWTYKCTTNLTKTTTNTVTATGWANGLMATDFSIATVVVAAPGLPNTGFGPDGKNSTWILIIASGILLVFLGSLVLSNKKIMKWLKR